MKSTTKRFYLAVFALLGASSAHDHNTYARKPGPASHESCAIDPNAIVSDACASFSTLDSLNSELQPFIHTLTHTSDFFSYYRLNLFNKKCPFWADEGGMCGNIACAVNTIENEDEIPLTWRAAELGKLQGPKAGHPDRQLQQEQKPLKGELGAEVGESCVVEYDDECDERDYCVPEDESAAAKGDYVSLVENPERFTGYSGPGANHVWEAIYRENCFSKPSEPLQVTAQTSSSPLGMSNTRQKAAVNNLRSIMKNPTREQIPDPGAEYSPLGKDLELDDQCLEKRVFYRVISGMHTSISTHLCWDHLNQTTGMWGPNLQCYTQRLHEHPERISNLYFNYALVLRAVAKVRNILGGYTFCSGDPVQDQVTKDRILSLANKIASGPRIYDESLMFQDHSIVGLKDDFRSRFRNVSRTMDCVGCDKCRLWGKLQTAGYGTALKILFEFDEHDSSNNPPLRRTELVALINTLDKISHSLSAIAKFEGMIDAGLVVAPDAAVLDDGLLEQDQRSAAPDSGDDTVREKFVSEFQLILNTVKWVLRQWVAIPRIMINALKVLIIRFCDLWLGVPLNYPAERKWQYDFSHAGPPPMAAAAGKRDEL